MNITQKLKEYIAVSIYPILNIFHLYPKIYNTDSTIKALQKKHISISRFGDGEFSLIAHKNIGFQKYNKDLAQRLSDILKSNEKDHLVALPNIFTDTSWMREKSRRFWIKEKRKSLLYWIKLIDLNKVYYDSLFTRFYLDYKDKSQSSKIITEIKKIWNKRDILFVEGENSKLGVGNDLFNNAQSIKRIICPGIDAFSKYDEILKTVQCCANPNQLILIALGPTATVLAYDLHSLGFQAIDLGHADIEYEWFLRGVKEKTPIKGKFVNEVKIGNILEENETLLKKYNNEIIIDLSI